MADHSRREFLQGLGVAAVGAAGVGALVGCVADADSVTGDSGEIRAQLGSITGRVIYPGEQDFESASRPFDGYVNFGPPLAVLEAANAADVAIGIAAAVRSGWAMAARGGGHSYAGYSSTSGLLISMAAMNSVSVDPVTNLVTVGSGARLGEIYRELLAHNLILPGGSCPTVGISGHTMGGGFGLNGRKYGLMADSLRQATVVLADGTTVTANQSTNADLFWALRGGGGGNFGYVTEFVFQAYPAPQQLSVFVSHWPWGKMQEVFAAWQQVMSKASDDLTSICTLSKSGSGSTTRALPEAGPPSTVADADGYAVQTAGQFHGTASELRALLRPLYDVVAPLDDSVEDVSVEQAIFLFAGCNDWQQCQMIPAGSIGYFDYYVKSGYAAKPYSREALDAMRSSIETAPISATQSTVLEFDSFGGAVNKVSPRATAFVHRNQFLQGQYQVYLEPDDPAATTQKAVAWLGGFTQTMAPFNSGFAYQNYIDGDLPNWQQAYYGANLDRLKSIKAKYDPKNVFNFKQSIPLA